MCDGQYLVGCYAHSFILLPMHPSVRHSRRASFPPNSLVLSFIRFVLSSDVRSFLPSFLPSFLTELN